MTPTVEHSTSYSLTSLGCIEFGRRDVGPTGVQADIPDCGICQGDVHQAGNN